MNKCRYLHNILNENTTRLSWCKAQLNFKQHLSNITYTKKTICDLLIISLLSIKT